MLEQSSRQGLSSAYSCNHHRRLWCRGYLFIDHWGILAFKKKKAGITGKNWMTKMLGLLRKGSTDRLKLSQMNMDA